MKDLIILSADNTMNNMIQGLIPRIIKVENMNEFTYDSYVHPERDPGVYSDSDEFLRSFATLYEHAIVILDRAGSGQEDRTRQEIENDIESRLSSSGWNQRACAIVIDPELENWVWVNETRIKEAVSWDYQLGIYDWLQTSGWKEHDNPKPSNPKEAFEALLKKCRTPRSSSIYKKIASTSSYQQCRDPAFRKMIDILRYWFSIS